MQDGKLLLINLMKKMDAMCDRVDVMHERVLALFPSPPPPGPEPELFSQPRAAKRLGVGLDKLRVLIASGEIKTRRSGGREMVPLIEILRYSKPDAPTTPVRSGSQQRAAFDAKAEAAKVRAALRKQR